MVGSEKLNSRKYLVKVPYCFRNLHLGHSRVTVVCQSDSALFALGFNLAKSCEERWPITALELPEVNKPQARISGVGDSMI
jgi:hypothetical protein